MTDGLELWQRRTSRGSFGLTRHRNSTGKMERYTSLCVDQMCIGIHTLHPILPPSVCVQGVPIVLVVTGVSVMILDAKSLSLKYRVELNHLDQISVSSFSDHMFVLHINPVSLAAIVIA